MRQDDKLEKHYRSLDIIRQISEATAAVVSNLAYQNPSMRILEIGGGRGAGAAAMLRSLGSRFASYHFTDVSSNSFADAKEACLDWNDKMKYTMLDLESDPLAQGFELDYYDLILASNMLHLANDMAVTMKRVRSLLRAGGKLLMAETTTTLLFTTVIFGTLPSETLPVMFISDLANLCSLVAWQGI